MAYQVARPSRVRAVYLSELALEQVCGFDFDRLIRVRLIGTNSHMVEPKSVSSHNTLSCTLIGMSIDFLGLS